VLSVAPAVLDFGRLAPGGAAQAAFVISNAGGSALTGTASGWAAPFAAADAGVFSLSPAETTNLVFTFAPTNAGVFSNAVVFTSNGGGATNGLAGQSLGRVTLRELGWDDAGWRVTFESVTGFGYELQFKESLFDAGWQTADSAAGSGGLLTLTNAAPAATQRFFRVRVP
jgi:hypothetical protein